MAVTRSNDFWTLVRFQSHQNQHFSRLSLTSRLNIDECTRRRNISGTLTTLGKIFNETVEEKPFISKQNEITCGKFSHFSWACVFYILSCNNKNEIRLFMFSDVLGCSTHQVSLQNQLLRKTSWNKQTERRAVSQIFHKTHTDKKIITTMQYFL